MDRVSLHRGKWLRTSLIKGVSGFLSLGLLFGVQAQGQTSKPTKNGIAATVNGEVITHSAVENAVISQLQLEMVSNPGNRGSINEAKIRREALDTLIDRSLILAEFKKKGGRIGPQYVEDDINQLIRDQFDGDRKKFLTELQKSGLTIRKFREMREEMMIVQYLRAQNTAGTPPPTTSQIRKYYDRNIDTFREQTKVKLSTITIPKFTGNPADTIESRRQLAQSIVRRARAKEDFGQLARTYSQDSRASDGGTIGWVTRTDINAQLADVAFAMKKGQVSDVIENEEVLLILFTEDKELGPAKSFEEVREQCERAVVMEMRKEAMDKWLATLRQSAVIKKF